MKFRQFRLMAAAGGDGGAGSGGGAAGDGAGAGGDGAAAGAGDGGAGASGAGAEAGDGAGKSALSTGAGDGAGSEGGDGKGAGDGAGAGAAAGADEWSAAKVPEKFQVKNDKGELDVNATFKKVEEHRANLEKRLGKGEGVRPKTADDYKLPESDTFKSLQLDETSTKTFQAEAHEMGLSQDQYAKVMEKYAGLAPQLVNAGQALSAEDTIKTLEGVWKDDSKAQMAGAYNVAQKLAKAAGVSYEEVDAAIGNNPIAIRLFATLTKDMGEDKTPSSANGGTGSGGETIEGLLGHPAYSDVRHAEHKLISKKVRDYYEKNAPADD